MANTVITVLEADGITETDIDVLGLGRQPATTSKSVTFSNEDYAAFDGIEAALGTIDLRLENLGLSQPLPTGAATQATLATRLSEADFDTKIGSLTETAPTTDTASSGLNGRMQRIAQRISSLIALVPAALTAGGNFKVSLQESNASQAVTGTFWQATQAVSGTFWQALQPVSLSAVTAGGCLVARKIDLDEIPFAIKAAAGQLYGFYIVNRTTAPLFLRFYNIVAGSVIVGTSAVHFGPIEIPANATDHTMLIVNFPAGIEFGTAMSMAATTGLLDTDTGAPASNALIVMALYK